MKINSWNSIWHQVKIQFNNYVLNRRINLFFLESIPALGQGPGFILTHLPSTWSEGCHMVSMPYLRMPYLKHKGAGAQGDSVSYAEITRKLGRLRTCSQVHPCSSAPPPFRSSSLCITPAWPLCPSLHNNSLIISGLLIF